MRITILGCGSSGGVPLIGCDCAVCRSDDPKNKRLRVSLLAEVQGRHILFDTSPDLRQQALRAEIKKVDAVLYTHEHADHTHGIDDLRSFNFISDGAVDLYGDNFTISSIKQRFPYAFQAKPENVWYRPWLIPHVLPDDDIHHFTVSGVPVTLFTQWHGKVRTVGYRIGKFGYSTDTDRLPDTAFEALKGVEVWIVDCLRYAESYSHSNLQRTLGWIDRLKPKLAVLTHMAHDFDYATLSAELPSGVVPGYDGMVIEL